MTRLVTLYNGNGSQHYAFHESQFSRGFGEILHQTNLDALEPSAVDGLLIPSRMHLGTLAAHADTVRAVLRAGGHLVLFGKRHLPLFEDLRFDPRPTNFWWWMEPDADSGLRFPRPQHPFFSHVPPEDCEWHFHGVFDPPSCAEVLIEDVRGGAVVYMDEETYEGTLFAACLDPIYHFGSRFMPATERFLAGFLPWLQTRIGTGQAKPDEKARYAGPSARP